ncbi:MAG: hypothetical protein KIC38_01690 [Actinomycetaceae bacterium]|nr:hypothetical protein [Actinomycetaceae bacterium]
MTWFSDAAWIGAIASLLGALVAIGSAVFTVWWEYFRRKQAFFIADAVLELQGMDFSAMPIDIAEGDPDFLLRLTNVGDGDAYRLQAREFSDFDVLIFKVDPKSPSGASPEREPHFSPSESGFLAIWLHDKSSIKFPFVCMLNWTEPPVRRHDQLMQPLYVVDMHHLWYGEPLRPRRYAYKRGHGMLHAYPFARPKWYRRAALKTWRKNPYQYAEKYLNLPRLELKNPLDLDPQVAQSSLLRYHHAYSQQQEHQPQAQSQQPRQNPRRRKQRK